ncbi:PHP domain-containing protein [bacterium]|nr:PHP domain-containing protein [bacterium]
MVLDQTDFVDLHMHSVHSDGQLPIRSIIDFAAGAGLRAIAITDHDTVEGVDEAMQLGREKGLEIISGVELSATIENRDIHILGYLFNHSDKHFLDRISHFKDERYKRAEKMVRKLNNAGVHLQMDSVMEFAGQAAVGRPHIADAMVKHGFAESIEVAFRDYIGYGGIAYEDKFNITPEEAIRIITDAGGLSFLAHPSLNLKQKYLYQVIRSGIHGIETIHPNHSESSSSYYKRIAMQHALLESGGSDCHGRNGEINIGKYRVPYRVIEAMKEKLNKKTGGR